VTRPAERRPAHAGPSRWARVRAAGRLAHTAAAAGIVATLGLGVTTLAVGPGAGAAEVYDPQPSVSIEEAHPGPAGEVSRAPGTPGFDPRQANLVTAEDQRIFGMVGQVLPGTAARTLTSPHAPPTLVLPGRTTPYTLDNLVEQGAVTRSPEGYLLVKSVLAAAGAQLRLDLPGGQLRMVSTPDGFTSIVGFKAQLELSGAQGAPLTLSSWNPAASATDSDETDGRAYLRAIGGRLDLSHVSTVDLGFWSGRTGGVAWTGSTSASTAGSASDLTTSGNHYGLFFSRSDGVLVNGAQIMRSVMDGVSVHTASTGTQLWNAVISDSGRNGVVVGAGARDTALRQVTATGSARNGIYLNGTPPASGPNAGGGTTAPASGFTVADSTSRGNSEHGVLVTGANQVTLSNDTVAANRDGVIVRGGTDGVVLRGNRISSPGGFAVAVRGGSTHTVVDQNMITNALTAVQVNDSAVAITNNDVAGMTVHAVALIGRSTGSSVKDNRVDGRGPSAIDTSRLAFGGVVTESGNDASNWTVDHDDVQFLSSFVSKHPLVLLWLLTLTFPLVARIVYRRRSRRTLGAHPYPNSAPPVVVARPRPAPAGRAPGRGRPGAPSPSTFRGGRVPPRALPESPVALPCFPALSGPAPAPRAAAGPAALHPPPPVPLPSPSTSARRSADPPGVSAGPVGVSAGPAGAGGPAEAAAGTTPPAVPAARPPDPADTGPRTPDPADTGPRTPDPADTGPRPPGPRAGEQHPDRPPAPPSALPPGRAGGTRITVVTPK
jgi:hypothetical protein